MTNGICHRVIAISRIFLKDQWKFLPWWLLSKSEYNAFFPHFQRGRHSVFCSHRRGVKVLQQSRETRINHY